MNVLGGSALAPATAGSMPGQMRAGSSEQRGDRAEGGPRAYLPKNTTMGNAAEKTVSKPRGRPFERGKSANPSGRPKGSRNKTTMAVEALLDGEADTITR